MYNSGTLKAKTVLLIKSLCSAEKFLAISDADSQCTYLNLGESNFAAINKIKQMQSKSENEDD